MKLYQRIKIVARDCAGSEVKMGTAMGMHPRTLNGYLKDSREHNLWPLLPKILEIWDQINRDWLYFGEGEMLLPEGGTKAPAKSAEAADPTAQDMAAKVRELEAEVLRLSRDLLASKDKIIVLYEQQNSGHRSVFTERTGNAPTGTTAPTVSPPGNEPGQ